MTIEEKAKEFAGYNMPSSQDIVTTAKMSSKHDGFKEGARWMLDKAISLIEDSVIFDRFGRPVKSETLRKALEE